MAAHRGAREWCAGRATGMAAGCSGLKWAAISWELVGAVWAGRLCAGPVSCKQPVWGWHVVESFCMKKFNHTPASSWWPLAHGPIQPHTGPACNHPAQTAYTDSKMLLLISTHSGRRMAAGSPSHTPPTCTPISHLTILSLFDISDICSYNFRFNLQLICCSYSSGT